MMFQKYIAGSNDTAVIKLLDHNPTTVAYGVDAFPHGSLLIQIANIAEGCVVTCVTRLWVVSCPVGCTAPSFAEVTLTPFVP